ncbi:unnamed protein product [Hydatigera taeniaeformis]|uniref:Uncharacterized protein n=1 Tax=Hydatigena taeniaeformis TaxID=6205 RepID=A0A0R3XAZ4_HYDTA|nr:unnamed protein product [Hydatigera taeniaeformis]
MESTSQLNRQGDDEPGRRVKNNTRAGLSCVGWANSALQSDLLTSPSGESSETFQESDSSGGSCQTNVFPSVRKGTAPPNVLLASVLNEQMRRPTKPPQTLEEAQHRIAYMENQLTQLTAWVRAVQAQSGSDGESGAPTGPSVKDIDAAVVENKHPFAHCYSGYESLDSHIADYKAGRKEIEAWLKDLDACIEEMRVDALNRRCRVSVAEVEAYALHLSRLSQRLASFKGPD